MFKLMCLMKIMPIDKKSADISPIRLKFFDLKAYYWYANSVNMYMSVFLLRLYCFMDNLSLKYRDYSPGS